MASLDLALASCSDSLCGAVANLAVLKPSRDEERASDYQPDAMAPTESPFADHGEQNSEYTEDAKNRSDPHAPANHLRTPFDDLPVGTNSPTLA